MYLRGSQWSCVRFDHLIEHGVLDVATLYESPFTDLTPHSPKGFSPPRRSMRS